jgi:hypothetical protein
MKCVRLAAVAMFSIAMSLPGRAQTLPGYTLQEIVLVPVTGATVSSLSTLENGAHYKLRALGTATVTVPSFGFTYQKGDAEYGFGDPPFPFLGDYADGCFFGMDVGLAINDQSNGSQKTPFWGSYNTAHAYTVDFTGLGAPISLNYHDCIHSGNDGVLTVEIFRPMGMPLATTGQPSLTDVSPQIDTFAWSAQHSVSGRANALAVTPDGTRLYTGTFAGVWRSDDAGLTWRQMSRPQPAPGSPPPDGALFVPDVYDIAISPASGDVVLAAVASDTHAQALNGVYRSEDGGGTWALVKQFACSNGGEVSQIVFAPDDPNLVFAAGGCAIGISGDGGKTWKETALPKSNSAWHIAVAPFEPPVVLEQNTIGVGPLGVRRVYALGSNQMFYSIDGGQNWIADSGISAIVNRAGVGGAAAPNSGNSSRVLMVEPGNNQHVLVAVNSLANGPSYYVKHQCGVDMAQPEFDDGLTCNTGGRGCGEGSIWLGDFSSFTVSDPNQHAASWMQLPSPPTYWGVTSPSGNTYANVKPVGNSYLAFFSDKSHVHVSAGLPSSGGWHRIEGLDASRTAPPHPPNPYCNNVFVHADPHAMAMSFNFTLTLQDPGTAAPYNENKVAGSNSAGDLWLANDGGVYHANGALSNWRPASGLSTLAAINIAGLAVKGYPPALYFGTGDNDDFYSVDGGASWKNPQWDCGDCDPWFADPAQVQQVMTFGARVPGGGFQVYTNTTKYPEVEPNPQDGTLRAHWVCPTDCNAVSSYFDRGYRPMVLTPAGTDASASGDYLIIGTKSNGARAVFRKTNTEPIDTPADWEDPSKAGQYGPDLPSCGTALAADCLDVVQASGGHAAPVLYVGDPGAGPDDGGRVHAMSLWKWWPEAKDWQQIVPSPPATPAGKTATRAHRFFVDPFNSNTIYLLDDAAVKRSDDGGATWIVDVSLDNAVTESHVYSYAGAFAVIKDMIFVRGESRTRFAVGNAGVFYTLNGVNWSRLLSTSALPSHPVSAYFDPISDPCDRALYVALDGRGLLRIDPIPSPGRIFGPRPCYVLEPPAVE